MATSAQLLDSLLKTGEIVQGIIRNFKKDSADRKTTIKYYEERLRRLSDAWTEFETCDSKLRMHADAEKLRTEHEYFQQDYYSQIKELTDSYMEKFSAEVEQFKQQLPEDKNQLPESLENVLPKPTHHTRQNTITTTSNHQQTTHERARMVALERFLNGISSIKETQPAQYYSIKIATINKLWNQIQELYYEIFDKFKEPTESGFNIQEYNTLDDNVQQHLVNLSVMAATLQSNPVVGEPQSTVPTHSTVRGSLPLPKVIIPQFNGDYLKWRQFHDLFSEMVDRQAIPNIQKMWYLKTNLSGEAAHLISQFSLTEENYQAAWTSLKNRYDNKRVLVSNLIEKILNQPTGTSAATAVKNLHDTTKECLSALNNIGIETSAWDPLLIHLLIKKLDRNMLVRFMQVSAKPKEVPTIPEFLSFLEIQFQSMEAIGQKPTNKAVSSVALSDGNHNTCKFCNNGNHQLYHCSKFIQSPVPDRLRWVQQQSLCVNCFRSDHISKTCTLGCCRKCNKKHNTLLHLETKQTSKPKHASKQPSAQSSEEKTVKEKASTSSATVTSTSAKDTGGPQGYVLLATAKVRITADNGNVGEFRAILDSGSQVNIVSQRLINRLGITPTDAVLNIDGIGNAQKRSTQRVNLKMQSTINNFSSRLEAFVLPHIIPSQPSHQIDTSSWAIPENIQFADPEFHQQGKIDILLGAELYFDIMKVGQIKLSQQLPVLQNTALGWIVGGPIRQTTTSNPSCALTCAIFSNTTLEEAIERLWKLDEIEPDEKSISPSERQCESHFNHNTRTDKNGRFIVSLPLRENPAILGESYTIAYNRFMSLERKLLKTEEVRKQYIQFMQEYEQLGHMQQVNLDSLLGPKYFIPHLCVSKPDSTTTKLRVVFDASAKTSTGYPLNDLMFNGPTVQSELFSILLRFRLPKFVFTTDIEKMYRQILVNPDDHQYQLILWREDPALPLNCYKLNTVTYGTRAAPYLATRCLRRIADENIVNYPLGSQMLKDNFYVDDGLGGADSLNIAIAIQKELMQILQKHGFNLKKWCANHPQLLKNIPIGNQEVNLDFNSDNTNSIKALGLLWLPKTDHMCVKAKLGPVQIISKRTATSDLAKLFDPLGLLAPIVVKAKMFIQQLWQLRLDWDEPLPKDLQATWNRFRTDLDSLNNLQISRHIFKGEVPVKTQLHVFADASEKAFGAVAYIRASHKDGRISVRLLCAKTRVAPLKQQTLPRLELCAAVLAAQLAHRVKLDIQMKDQPLFLWTDSEIVLSWINTQSSLYQTFVANRIATIQSLTSPDQWRHVGSKDNPADILSRGLSPTKLSGCNLWFYGPLFLHAREGMWPPTFSQQLQTSDDIEKKKVSPISAAAVSNDDITYRIECRNSFRTLQRILAYCIRFSENSRAKKEDRPTHKALTPMELDKALFVIIRNIQKSEFSPEINQLRKNQEIDRKSFIASLNPFLDENNILRVGGRLEASTLPYDAKHPMITPYNDPLMKLLFTMVHEENKHCGPQALLNIIRQRFWPVKGKITARSTVQKCVRCTRARPQLCQQIMGNLPQSRVTPARPFINAGVDYCGPFWIHYKIRGKKPTKAYIAVFCCFATKAVHLELVTDLTTEAFIGALKRFISRRGRCQHIYSDNATNFIGARNQLTELTDSIYSNKGQETIMSTASSRGIHFHFIPPRAPHFGGLWEAAVKSAKHLLLRSVATASLTQEELETVIVEVEAILNSRPLTPMSNDPTDLEALTPGHFLIGEALTSQIDSSAITSKRPVLRHWELVTQLKQKFWNRWSTEYLNELQQRNKWKEKSANLKPGDMVIIKEDNVPALQWPLGRIINVHEGPDESTRVVDVKTAKGVFKRTIQRLALLPIDTYPEATLTTNDDKQEPNSCNPDTTEEPKPKRKKMLTNHLMVSLLAILLCLPLVLGTPVVIKKFGTKAGIHFEHIGTITLSTSEWNLLVYYDLNTYWSETASLINGTRSLLGLCKILTLNTSCLNIIDHFENMEGELQLDNRLLRSKRGAINIVGNVAHSLFGILDSDYANQMSDTILKVKENEAYLLHLLQHQTSVVDSTINIMRQNQLVTKARFEHLEQEITLYSKEITNVNKALLQVHLSQLFNSGALQLELIANNLLKMQSLIFNTLMDTQHGKISPSLLTPEQLQKAVDQINLHSPSSLKIPVTDKNELLQLFKLMKVKGRITHQHVVFKITLPLVENEDFKTFYMTPIPNTSNGTMVAITPCSAVLGIAASREQYIVLTESELSSCDVVQQDVFLCSNVQMRYNYGSERCACEINLFNNKTTPACRKNYHQMGTTQ